MPVQFPHVELQSTHGIQEAHSTQDMRPNVDGLIVNLEHTPERALIGKGCSSVNS